MYKKILKESGSTLAVLVVGEANEYREILDTKLSHFFETFVYTSDREEALLLYNSEQFHIVVIAMDEESINGVELIEEIQKVNPYQSIFVYSNNIEDSALLMKLLNLGVSCYIDKAEALENYYKIFSKVTTQMCDLKILMHYVAELETGTLELSISTNVTQEDDFEFFPTPSAEEDDFDFFPTPSAQTTEQDTMYQDYFSFLDLEDREDLRDQLSEIDTTLLNAFTETGGDAAYIVKLGSLLMRYGNILMNYQFFSDMGMAILEFGKVISDESVIVAREANNMHPLISGFCSGLQVFMVEVWETESDNPKYFNDSIINDARLILELVVPPVTVDNEDDLVFF